MDADTYQQVAVPAAARLTEKENSEVVVLPKLMHE
jgi:hypothetical protein